IAAIYTLNSLNNDSELVIVTNSGATPFTILKPILFLAILIAVVDSSVSHYFSPNARREIRVFFTEINSDLISSVIKPGEFASINNGITFYVGARDANGIFNDVVVNDNREEEQTLTYLAKHGAITRTTEGTFFVLQDGTIHRRPKERDSISIIDYSSYAFDLSTFERRVPNELRFKKPSENFTPYLFKVDSRNDNFVKSPSKFYAELHNRFASPFYSIAYVMIVFFFLGTAQSTRQGRGFAVLSALLTVLALRGGGFMVQSGAKANTLLNFVQYLLPLGTIAICTLLIARNVEPRGLQALGFKLEQFCNSLRRLRPGSNVGGS
ncbi:MAG: LptF/LptG family permease, partial [Hyphomicrobiales bacterium]